MEILKKQHLKDVCSTGLKPHYWLWVRKGKKYFGKLSIVSKWDFAKAWTLLAEPGDGNSWVPCCTIPCQCWTTTKGSWSSDCHLLSLDESCSSVPFCQCSGPFALQRLCTVMFSARTGGLAVASSGCWQLCTGMSPRASSAAL